MRTLRTAHWHSDETIELAWPVDWSVSVLWPATPPPLADEQILDALHNPVGMPPIADLCRGKRRPLVGTLRVVHRSLPGILDHRQ